MPKVPGTMLADKLYPLSITINMATYCTFNFIIKTRPAAAGIEFVF